MQTADEFLESFHAAHPGATDVAFRRGRIDGGALSSYDLLAREVAEHTGGEIAMDLACGDGALTERILSQPLPPAVVIGIDPSAAELKKAQRRVRRRAVFHRCRAQELPTPSQEVAAVGCHMALMLLDPVEPVLAHIARVLIPGGMFGAIVPSGQPASPVLEAYHRQLDGVQIDRPKLGDRRVYQEEGLRELLTPHFERVELSEHVLSYRAPIAEIWAENLSKSYDIFALPPAERVTIRDALLAEFGDDEVEYGTGLRLIRAWVGG